MAGRAVELRVGGQTYRVVSSASPEELTRLAAVVDEKLHAVVPAGRPITPQALLLAAMALAHDLEQQRDDAAARSDELSTLRQRTAAVSARSREVVERLVTRVEAAIAATGVEADDSPGS